MQAHFLRFLGLLFFCWTLLGSCEFINPKEEIPAYIYVVPFQLKTDPTAQGSASEKITEVWLTVNDEFLGVYRLPSLIPVLKTGSTKIKLEAGIKENGISTTPDIYPFYQPFETQVDLQPNEVDTLRPKTAYKANVKFSILENFERAPHTFDALIGGQAYSRITITNVGAFEGSSGLINLNEQNPAVVLGSVNKVSGLLDKGTVVFLEANYKAEAQAAFGVIPLPFSGDPQLVYAGGFNPSATWNKIYFNLTKVVFDSKAKEFQIILRAELPTKDGAITLNTARIWLDNIKLVHY
jgi:hypothetical protein